MPHIKDANPPHPYDRFTTASLVSPIVAGMQTSETAVAPTTPGPTERPIRIGPEPSRSGLSCAARTTGGEPA
jgi:hypothetical protein